VEQGQPVVRKGRTLVSERLGQGLDSPSGDWWGRLGRKRLRRRSAARRAAVGHCGRNAGEQAVRPANARAREGPRGASGGDCGAWTRGRVEDSGAHKRAWAVGDSGCRGRGTSGGPIGAHAHQLARPAGPRRVGRYAWQATVAKRRGSANGRARGARVHVAVGPATMANAWTTP
jgi:hypothetical protein